MGRFVRPKYGKNSSRFSLRCFVEFDFRRTQPELSGWLNYQKYIIDSTGKVRARLKAPECARMFFLPRAQSRPQSSSAHDIRGGRALGSLGTKLTLIGFSKKQQKCVIGPFKFARERVNARRVWRVSGFFPRNVEVNNSGRFLILAIPKQRSHD